MNQTAVDPVDDDAQMIMDVVNTMVCRRGSNLAEAIYSMEALRDLLDERINRMKADLKQLRALSAG